MPSVCILYGFCEGPRVARRFLRALTRAGYEISTEPSTADILITHSGGCYLLPPKIRAKRIIHIGMWYWPGRSWLSCAWYKVRHDLRTHHQDGELRFWLRKTFWNFAYFWNMPANIRMLKGRATGTPWGHGAITTVVRPKFDSFCTPDLASLPFTKQPACVTTPGHHDDCWRNPSPYIDLLQSEYGERLLAAPRGPKAAVSRAGVEPARTQSPSR